MDTTSTETGSIRMARGATMRVRVYDPGRGLSPADTAGSAHLVVAVGSRSGAVHNPVISSKEIRPGINLAVQHFTLTP